MKQYVWLAVVVAWAGCTSPNPKSCLDDHHCSDPALPFCDEDGAIGGTPGTCIAVACTANEFSECRGDTALTCNATGDDFVLVDCPYGCGATGCLPCNTSDCEKHIIPKYLPAICDSLTTAPALTISQDRVLDTSVASDCSTVVTQMGAPEICVFRASTISIESQKTLKVVGTRVLALVADRELVVDGVLDVSADRATNGPGGGFVKSGSGAGQAGGGAGFRTSGGSGGSDAGNGGSANGGAAGTNASQVVSLFGGSQPSQAAGSTPPGGGGGGATLVSCRGTVTVRGVLDAGGGGGYSDEFHAPPPTYYPGAGGGAGGTIAVQGMAVTFVGGSAYANGGGGGGGAGAGGIALSVDGADGLRSTNVAPGGPAVNSGGAGGYGGATVPAENGYRPSGTTCGSGCGGGGGSAGFVLTLTPVGSSPALGTATVSPAFEPNVTIPTN